MNDNTNVEFIEKTGMKKQYVSLLAIILSVSGFLFSCHDKMNKNTGALQFDSIQVNKTAHLFNDTAKPACNIIINFAFYKNRQQSFLSFRLFGGVFTVRI